MRVMHILPELDLGGVERHVIDLANEQVRRGWDVCVVSAGGRMESQFSPGVKLWHLPVHRKNLLTGAFCACRIAHCVKSERYDLLHAHSRVPAWIAWWAASLASVPFVVTAHGIFNTRVRLIYAPYRAANCAVCVSEAVRSTMRDCFYENTKVIVNGIRRPSRRWNPANKGQNKLLFVGRLSFVKGLQDVFPALPTDLPWSLDVVGEGPQLAEWAEQCRSLGIADRVTFHGYSDKVEEFMADASCLLFPSHREGMPLTLAQAVLMGLPVLASDIEPVAEMMGGKDGLVPVGDLAAWKTTLTDFLQGKLEPRPFPVSCVPTLEKMVDELEAVYRSCLEPSAE